MLRRLLALAGIGVIAASFLTGCSQTVTMDPAPRANDPACAEVSVLLPPVVAGQERRWTDAQATGAWGDPVTILLTCGLEPPGPSVLPCQTFGGVDWIVDESELPRYRVTTFDRDPAVQLYIDSAAEGGVSSGDVLESISRFVGVLPSNGASCTDRPGT